MALPPSIPQRWPDLFILAPTSVLQALSVTPDPIGTFMGVQLSQSVLGVPRWQGVSVSHLFRDDRFCVTVSPVCQESGGFSGLEACWGVSAPPNMWYTDRTINRAYPVNADTHYM